MDMIEKTISSLKKSGILETLKKIARYIKFKIISNRRKIKNINRLVNINDFKTIIVFENNFGWNKIMKQRPQQIAENLPKDVLMFYHSHEGGDYTDRKRIRKIKDNLILTDLGYYRDALFEVLKDYNNKYLMIYSTDHIEYERINHYENNGYGIIYEYVDGFDVDLNSDELHKELLNRHNKIIERDDSFVICTADKLALDIKQKGKEYKLVTNGVNYEHFKYQNYPIPEDLIEIKKQFKNIICYYGAIASWFDYHLVEKIASNKDNAIVLIGQDYDDSLKKSNVLEHKNVFYLGRKDYKDLPAYGCNIDIFIIPFIINNITKSTSPVKVFEYMAMEKPIVTTALPECKKYQSVLYSTNEKEFLKNIDKAIKLRKDKKYLSLLRKEAKNNTWDSKARDIINYINTYKYRNLENIIDQAINNKEIDRIVIWRSPFGWDVPLFQRPQHISRQLAKKRCLVFYEVSNKTDNVGMIKKEADNLYLVNMTASDVSNVLINKVSGLKIPKYIQIYSTNWTMSLDEMNGYIKKGFQILYEYVDDINPDLAGATEVPSSIIDKYNYVMNNTSIPVVTTANELTKDVIKKRGKKNTVLSCNGVDNNFFKDIDKNYDFESEFTKVISNGKINVCYYGALAKWFDYKLIKRINDTNLYNIILFGIKYDDSFNKSKINYLKNVHFFGPREYECLKNYASKMDILTIPFVINDITKATSPLKLFEYMALNKPIVTTAMDECKKYKSVLVANNHDEFLEFLKKSYSLRNDKKYIELLKKEAADNDWNNKAQIIIDFLKEYETKNK